MIFPEMLSADELKLHTVAEGVVYFTPVCGGRVTYLAGPGADRFEARADRSGGYYVTRCDSERDLGSRKTAKGVLTLMVKLADAAYKELLRPAAPKTK
jgi:hypothetical protein